MVIPAAATTDVRIKSRRSIPPSPVAAREITRPPSVKKSRARRKPTYALQKVRKPQIILKSASCGRLAEHHRKVRPRSEVDEMAASSINAEPPAGHTA